MKVLDLANYIIVKSNELNIEIDPLKLQKLLYYIQGYTLKEFNMPAFDNKIEHWSYGPVVPEVYQNFKEFSNKPINLSSETEIIQPQYPFNLIWKAIVIACDEYSSKELANLTHQEKPWLNTTVNEEITKDSLSNFFKNDNPLNLNIQKIINDDEEEYNKFVDFILERDKEIFKALA